MKGTALFSKTSGLRGIYVFFILNRLQMLYFVLIMPMYLIQPYMIWAILAAGLLSQLNLILISKWFSREVSEKGYSGYAKIFGNTAIRITAFVALLPLLVKITAFVLGYVEIVNQYMFPAMNRNWLVAFVFAVCCYLASQGMTLTLRFAVVVFLSVVWINAAYLPFFFPPLAAYRDLYPLIPESWPTHAWQGLLYVWSALSGPEYLICLTPWFKEKQKMLKYLSWGNWFSVAEYLALFIATLLFFGPNYLARSHYPVINMVRYLQSPFFERFDLLLISFNAITLVFAVAFFLLCFYGAARIAVGSVERTSGRGGFAAASLTAFACVLVANNWLWETGSELRIWPRMQMWLGAASYFFLPVCLFAVAKLKGRAQ